MATKINIRTLLEAGCHFGHQTRRWNPKMKPFIFGERNGIYILDLKQTILDADQAYTFVKNVAKGGNVLFVGTKKQAQEAVKNAAERANMPYINQCSPRRSRLFSARSSPSSRPTSVVPAT